MYSLDILGCVLSGGYAGLGGVDNAGLGGLCIMDVVWVISEGLVVIWVVNSVGLGVGNVGLGGLQGWVWLGWTVVLRVVWVGSLKFDVVWVSRAGLSVTWVGSAKLWPCGEWLGRSVGWVDSMGLGGQCRVACGSGWGLGG